MRERKRVVDAAIELAESKILDVPIGAASKLVINKEQYKMFLLEALGNI